MINPSISIIITIFTQESLFQTIKDIIYKDGEAIHKKKSTNKGTETLSFRTDREIVDKLRQEADQKDVTINTLLNQIVKHHIDGIQLPIRQVL